MNTLGTVVLGVVAGVLLTLGADRIRQGLDAPAPRPAVGTPPANGAPAFGSLADDNARLKTECEALRGRPQEPTPEQAAAEEAMLERKITDLDRKLSGRKTREEKLALAKKILEVYAGLAAGSVDMQAAMHLQAWLKEMDEETAPYFIERYRAAKTSSERAVGHYLILQSGGPDAAGFLKEWLADASIPQEERDSLLRQVGMNPKVATGGLGMAALRPLPMDAELTQTVQRMSRSDRNEERMCAAGLMAWDDTPGSRQALVALSGSDPNPHVRAAAINSLARVGDPETLAFLERYPIPAMPDLKSLKDLTGPDDPRLAAMALNGAVRQAISSLKARLGK